MGMRIEISIAELHVEGLGAVDEAQLRAHLERDLARVVGERGLPGIVADRAVADARITLGWDGRDGTPGLAAALAERLYEGMA